MNLKKGLLPLLIGVSFPSVAVETRQPSKSSMNLRKPPVEEELPKVIRVERETPVFSGPSVKKRILADVDAGTMLIAKALSPKHSWIHVEDEDGNKGWIPVNRTNFKSLVTPTELVKDEDVEEAVNEEKEEQGQVPPLEALKVLEGTMHNYGVGIAASFLVLQSLDSALSRERRVGFELGAYREWRIKESSTRSVTLPILIRMMARSPGSGFFSGPDLGAQYRLKDKSWGAEFGYSFGWGAKTRAGPQTRARISAELGHRTRYLATWGFGWVF
jgi:hypothetical protein